MHKDIFFKDRTLLVNSSDRSCFVKDNRYSYNYINKGSYSSSYYVVKPGDTLFYISWITGCNCNTLAKKNNIEVNGILKVGQILKVGIDNQLNHKFLLEGFKKDNTKYNDVKKNLRTDCCSNIHVLKHSDDNYSKKKSFYFSSKSRGLMKFFSLSKNNIKAANNIVSDKINFLSKKSKVMSDNVLLRKDSHVFWNWPTNGRIISNFSSSEGGNKGIDISGVSGQPIFSASYGKVVYAGDALLGYGNLIIIKHSNDFLSTYAHNDEILVVEQQNVMGGQKIATMGNSGSDITKLHFEIRYKGRSVDPLYYLPKR